MATEIDNFDNVREVESLDNITDTDSPWDNGSGDAVTFNGAGTEMYVLNDDVIEKYALSTEWSPSSTDSTPEETFTFPSSNSKDIVFGDSGTKFYLLSNDGTDSEIEAFNLSTDYDLSTRSSVQITGLSDETHISLSFKPDGEKMFLSNNQDKEVDEYLLDNDFNNPWEVETPLLENTFSFESTNIFSAVTFRSDGTEMIKIESGLIVVFDLGTAWDVSTASSTSEGFSTDDSIAHGEFTESDRSLYLIDGGDIERWQRDPVIDDFEDGDVAEWSGDTADFSAQTGTVIEGTYTGELFAENETNSVTRNVSKTVPIAEAFIRLDDITDGLADFEFRGANGEIGRIRFSSLRQNAVWVSNGNINELGSWSTNETISFRVVFDYSAGEATVWYKQVEYGPFAFTNSASDVEELYLENDTPQPGPSSSASKNVFIDSINSLAGAELQSSYSDSFSLSATASFSSQGNLVGTVSTASGVVEDAQVYVYNNTQNSFAGYDVTDSDGDYFVEMNTADDGDELLVAVDYFDGSTYFGDEKSLILEK